MDVLIMFLMGNIHVKFMCLCEIGSMNCGHEIDQQNEHLKEKKDWIIRSGINDARTKCASTPLVGL